MAEAYPLYWPEGWPRTKRPERSRFDATFGRARQELIWEIERMGGRYPVLSTNIPLRRDGLPYAQTREPDDPGVSVYFQLGDKQMVFACDKWDRVCDNIRAIEKTIYAIRGIERWGASDMMNRALNAFEALPPPAGWRSDLLFQAHENPTAEEVKSRFRTLVKNHHPDAGGDPEQFKRINDAYSKAQQEFEAA